MTVGRLMRLLSQYGSDRKVYVYDEHRDEEREITVVGLANELMPEGVVLSIRGMEDRG